MFSTSVQASWAAMHKRPQPQSGSCCRSTEAKSRRCRWAGAAHHAVLGSGRTPSWLFTKRSAQLLDAPAAETRHRAGRQGSLKGMAGMWTACHVPAPRGILTNPIGMPPVFIPPTINHKLLRPALGAATRTSAAARPPSMAVPGHCHAQALDLVGTQAAQATGVGCRRCIRLLCRLVPSRLVQSRLVQSGPRMGQQPSKKRCMSLLRLQAQGARHLPCQVDPNQLLCHAAHHLPLTSPVHTRPVSSPSSVPRTSGRRANTPHSWVRPCCRPVMWEGEGDQQAFSGVEFHMTGTLAVRC